jgi:hypothetical protein
MSAAGARSLRHALDYRLPFRDYSDGEMAQLLDGLLGQLRTQGAQHLMVSCRWMSEISSIILPRF